MPRKVPFTACDQDGLPILKSLIGKDLDGLFAVRLRGGSGPSAPLPLSYDESGVIGVTVLAHHLGEFELQVDVLESQWVTSSGERQQECED